MKFVDQKAVLLLRQNNVSIIDKLKLIEKCGRICYKSEDKITDDSYIKFCRMLYSFKHWAVFEHAVFCYKIPESEFFEIIKTYEFQNLHNYTYRREGVYYLLCLNLNHIFQLVEMTREVVLTPIKKFFPTIKEVFDVLNITIDLSLTDSFELIETEEDFNTYYTFKCTTFRSVADELFRHRINAINCESSRYVNYNKDKFDKQIKSCEPHWHINRSVYNDLTEKMFMKLTESLKQAEKNYLDLIDLGMKPEDARAVLPMDYAVEFCFTASVEQWKYIFSLRISPQAHPNIQLLCNQIKNSILENN